MTDNTAGKPAAGELAKVIVENDIKAAEALLRRGADFTEENDAGWDMLTSAANYGRAEIVQLLIDAGANVNRQSPSGVTALMRAARMGHMEAARALLKNGADVTMRDGSGLPAITYAALKGRREMVQMLEGEIARVDRRRVTEGLHEEAVQKQRTLKGRASKVKIARGPRP